MEPRQRSSTGRHAPGDLPRRVDDKARKEGDREPESEAPLPSSPSTAERTRSRSQATPVRATLAAPLRPDLGGLPPCPTCRRPFPGSPPPYPSDSRSSEFRGGTMALDDELLEQLHLGDRERPTRSRLPAALEAFSRFGPGRRSENQHHRHPLVRQLAVDHPAYLDAQIERELHRLFGDEEPAPQLRTHQALRPQEDRGPEPRASVAERIASALQLPRFQRRRFLHRRPSPSVLQPNGPQEYAQTSFPEARRHWDRPGDDTDPLVLLQHEP